MAQEAAATPAIRYEDGALTVRIDKLPLGELLRKLGAVTGARFTLNDSSIARQKVSVSVEAQPYAQSIRQILDGFSYAIYPDESRPLPSVTVLSKGKTARSGIAGADDSGVGLREHATDWNEKVAGATTDDHGSEEPIDRALEALAAAKHIDHDVLEQLVGARDPRATEVLVQAASGSSDTESREQAVEALWRHTADRAFGDKNAVTSLEQLAEDADPRVRTIAHQALQDMKQFQQNNPAMIPQAP
ncbi:MAG: HEAT repeat domain-containing protein [Gammaproteobacteria bacterium]